MAEQKLFACGTLGPRCPNEHILKAVGGSWQTGSVCGSLRQEGWGAAMGYPGITLNDSGDKVEGFVFSSDNLEAHWPSLDEFEGEG